MAVSLTVAKNTIIQLFFIKRLKCSSYNYNMTCAWFKAEASEVTWY